MNFSELKEIAVIDWGNTSLTKKAYSENGKFLGVSAAGCDGRMDHAEHEEGTLVLSAIGANCGKMFYPKEPFTAIKNTITITPKEIADSKYLFYYLNNNQISSRGAGQPFITKTDTGKKSIPLPPLLIQKKIAAILDAANAYRQKTKALIVKYDELTQSLFLDMFGDPVTNPKGWEKYKGEEVCVKISVGVVIKPASYYVDKGVIALRSLNVKPFKIDLSDVVYFSQETHKNELKKSILKDGDVVVVRTGNTGTAALITKELDGINCIDLIIVRVDKSKLNANYLCHFLNSERGKELVAGKSVGGIHKHFNVGAMKGTNIPLPPIDLQRLFEKRVEILKSQQTKAQTSLDKAEDLFNSLLQRAFKGELI